MRLPLNVLKEDKQCSAQGLHRLDLKISCCSTIKIVGPATCKPMAQAYYTLKAIEHLGCMAHARRKFMDAKKVQGKGTTGKADVVLAKIQKLYALEARLK